MNIITSQKHVKAGFSLDPSEMRLVLDFRCLSPNKQEIYADAIGGCAEEERALRRMQKPALRLIAGGAA